MTPETVGPLSRLLLVDRIPPEGLDVVVEATPEECAALASDLKLPAIRSLEGRFRVTSSSRGIRVDGRVRAAILQTCVVTLDDFESTIDEEVEVDFAPPSEASAPVPGEVDRPDEIVDGQIDLGSLTGEFLALGLDPYPKKPGASFDYDGGGDEPPSPFAALANLKPRE